VPGADADKKTAWRTGTAFYRRIAMMLPAAS
jgi:hypothetical protein